MGEEGRFLGRKVGKEWRLEKNEGKKVGELCQGGQIRIRMGIVFRSLGLSGGAKMK